MPLWLHGSSRTRRSVRSHSSPPCEHPDCDRLHSLLRWWFGLSAGWVGGKTGARKVSRVSPAVPLLVTISCSSTVIACVAFVNEPLRI